MNNILIFFFSDYNIIADMLAQPSNLYSGYQQGPIVEASPLLYQHHSISRSDNLNVQPLHQPQPQQQQHHQQQRQYQQQYQQQPAAQYRSDDNPAPAAQTFLSTFFREHNPYIAPLTHTRNYFSTGEPFSTTPRAPRLTGHRNVESIPKASNFDTSILGSGDFGVLRGGTFYQDSDPTFFRSSESSNEYSYFNKNGHGRPQTAAYVQKYTYPEDQFANFRDFADINTPNEPAFSHYVVVYTNKNGSATTVIEQEEQEQSGSHKYEPKNILDQLRLLDEEKATTTEKSTKSKSKAKLKRTKLTRTHKKHPQPKKRGYGEQEEQVDKYMFGDALEDTPRVDIKEPIDPLLALS